MLVTIIVKYLQISEEQAKKLMDLLSLENRWQDEQQWKDTKFNLVTCKTQADVIGFLQAVGQTQWFKGHDRSKFADNISDQELNETYFSLFAGLGLTQNISYDTALGKPSFSVVLGSSESQVNSRVSSLQGDILSGDGPQEKRIYGLGCNRGLGVSVIDTEQTSKDKLSAAGIDANEMNMVSMLTHEMLAELVRKDDKYKSLVYQPINTTANVQSRLEKDCVKTADTATSLKQAIEERYDLEQLPKPINVAVYSRQPFVLRQQRDVQMKLGPDYLAIGVGSEFTQNAFNLHPKSIAVCLGEVARLVNINFTPENLKQFNVALTQQEMEELKILGGQLVEVTDNNAMQSIRDTSRLFSHNDTASTVKTEAMRFGNSQ
jgi:hypothetical protein